MESVAVHFKEDVKTFIKNFERDADSKFKDQFSELLETEEKKLIQEFSEI